MAGDRVQSLPIEERFIELETDGKMVLVPALNRTWVKLAEKNFSRYISHPDPGKADFLKERAIWLEITHFVAEDLEWLLRQEHHVFWSHMIFCMEAQWLVLTFLQDAPPYHSRHEFPKDEEMEYLLSKTEHLAFLVLRRLATKRESPEHHIRNLGDLLYNSYLFSIPMFFDIYNVYGFKNRPLVAKLFHDVVCISPKFLQDLEVVPPFFLKVLNMVKEKFDVSLSPLINEKSKMKPELMKNIFLHLLDACANMHMFFDINTNFAKCMRNETFLSDIAFFYTYTIPKINEYISKTSDSSFIPIKEKLNFMRLNLLSIVRTIFCCIINDIVNDEHNREEYANEYLTRLMDILQEQLFISDYNKVYPVENDLRMLCDLCPNLDTINLKYIVDAVASCSDTKYKPDELKEFRLATLISEVKDILPHLGDGFVEFCLRYYDYDTEKVVTAVIEDTLPSKLDKLDRNMTRPNEDSQKIVRARISAEKQFRIDKQRTTLEGVLDIGKPGANKYGINIGKKRVGGERETENGGAVGEEQADQADEGGEVEQKNKSGSGGGSTQNTEEAGPSGANGQQGGRKGSKGQQGGQKGAKGQQGGRKGSKGQQGGPRGANGQQGGASGASGEQAGASGASGEQAGASGASGEQAGASGASGEQAGASGASGEQAGPSGASGEEAGASGASGEEAQAGAGLNQEMVAVFNNKMEMVQIRDKILTYVRQMENYDDEYDDTYDQNNTLLKEGRNAEEDRKAGANRMMYRPRGSDYEERSSEEEGVHMDSARNIRARLLQRRMDKLRRDFIASKMAQVQEREEMLNRRLKEAKKSAIGNHDRRNNAAKKRNDLGNA